MIPSVVCLTAFEVYRTELESRAQQSRRGQNEAKEENGAEKRRDASLAGQLRPEALR